MELNQAIDLIKHQKVFNATKTSWADLGCGSGLFTNALGHMLVPGSTIFAVDNNIDALRRIQQLNNISIAKIKADFISDALSLNALDGILMANSLHFVKDKIEFIRKVEGYFKKPGCFLIVEYNTDKPTSWVPYPISFRSLQQLFESIQYSSIRKIHEVPSQLNQAKIYSSLITK